MSAKVIDGKAIAQNIRLSIKEQIEKIREDGKRAPCLAVILVGNDPASEVYVGHKKKACASIGIESRSLELPGDISQDELSKHVKALNDDPAIDGILLQLPLPKHLIPEIAIDLIDPDKDVDGLTAMNQGLLVWKRPGLVSCTPAGVMELIRSTGVKVEGARAVVMGRSVLVGAPIATMLCNAGATVNCLNSKTVNGPELTRQADILVVATGVHRLVRGDHIKPGAVVIDVGMHRHDGKLSGDVVYDEAKDVAGHITPVPGGVGPMTIAMLMRNCLTAYSKNNL
ncbi:bifunctional methylenetetrahydrofolate dehydrogenase/methenyltetrahydrofolate cyclohydrolase FolD [Pseudobacteriovorax antillogorgiicola]|uniref:Bifunctional protein FolD n=1 Tax=Pseudobacteriovorax antillogorgiicola TaxID=1513793 RepID=A0A1Y6CCL3_9BACT|nr:bifunctional methylenetetrahydrofolate dehydrogenase/methenyltetrahydrofolate cyclohydrolase FolD [Pseudobacteriovorax antillogorgiicola]TCS49497.1 methylenetetrahydrofolate dehydrogenase (NADP+)/methenyltetrahydrofolate cyclohydrolase [Pseudobacteriovorax antillogorgiicola]SMF45920.1 methylenetetrahydrofolate dehydrogenase (NADP+) / methenyltetrahydrofolate cyclohydrolase [Pseudobacteriovorax antillogorgiicola]